MTTTDRLRALLAEATPGPWRDDGADAFDEGGEIMACVDTADAHDLIATCPTGVFALRESEYSPDLHRERWARANGSQAAHDAALIVAAVNALPALLDVAEAAATFLDTRAELIAYRGGTDEAYQESLDRRLAETEAALRDALAKLDGEPNPR